MPLGPHCLPLQQRPCDCAIPSYPQFAHATVQSRAGRSRLSSRVIVGRSLRSRWEKPAGSHQCQHDREYLAAASLEREPVAGLIALVPGNHLTLPREDVRGQHYYCHSLNSFNRSRVHHEAVSLSSSPRVQNFPNRVIAVTAFACVHL